MLFVKQLRLMEAAMLECTLAEFVHICGLLFKVTPSPELGQWLDDIFSQKITPPGRFNTPSLPMLGAILYAGTSSMEIVLRSIQAPYYKLVIGSPGTKPGTYWFKIALSASTTQAEVLDAFPKNNVPQEYAIRAERALELDSVISREQLQELFKEFADRTFFSLLDRQFGALYPFTPKAERSVPYADLLSIGDLPLMTPKHPKWDEFCERLCGEEGCNFRKNEKGDDIWGCGGGDDQSFTVAILKKYFPEVYIPSTLAYFYECGGHCDCEVVFNVMGDEKED